MRLFVYGTLRSDGPASRLLEGCIPLGPAFVRGSLYDVQGRYPALVLDDRGRVEGELWECPPGLLPLLDRYEGVGEGLYRRVPTACGSDPCVTYVAGPALRSHLAPDRRIASGRWPPDRT